MAKQAKSPCHGAQVKQISGIDCCSVCKRPMPGWIEKMQGKEYIGARDNAGFIVFSGTRRATQKVD